MKYRTLGKTGLDVSVVGLGTWQFGGEWGKMFTQDEVNDIFGAAADEGINLIDTAECYGDHTSEEFIGRAIEADRETWVVATKFGHHFHGPFERDTAYAPDDVRRQLEASLRALKTDYIDLYQFHSGSDENFATPGLWETLQSFVESGKVRHLGISIGSNSNVHQTTQAGLVGAGAIQVVYNRLDREPEQSGVFEACRRQNLGVLARVPLASGYLSGKYDVGATFNQDDVRGRWHSEEKTRTALTEVAQIRERELPEGVPMARWALAWCLQHPAVSCVIPGCKSPEQVRENARAAGLDLVRDDHPQAAAMGSHGKAHKPRQES